MFTENQQKEGDLPWFGDTMHIIKFVDDQNL